LYWLLLWDSFNGGKGVAAWLRAVVSSLVGRPLVARVQFHYIQQYVHVHDRLTKFALDVRDLAVIEGSFSCGAEADAKRTRIRGKADTPPEEGGQ